MRARALVLTLFAASWLQGQQNPRYTYSIDGPCGRTIVGPPGSVYDDGTGGAPYFTDIVRGNRVPRNRPGHTWDVALTTAENIIDSGAYGWILAVGVEGPLRLTDITLDGTAGCQRGEFTECLRGAAPAWTELTGPPDGGGPQTEENRGAISIVLLKLDGLFTLPSEGSSAVCKLRVSAELPKTEGDTVEARVFFTTRISSFDTEFFCGVYGPERFGPNIGQGGPVTLERGDPPLTVEDCVVRLKASSVAAFIRCDPNEDGGLSITDAVWILGELFLGREAAPCQAAADCDGDGERALSDAVYALSHLFLGGPPPPVPYPHCDRLDIPVGDCPPGSTSCR